MAIRVPSEFHEKSGTGSEGCVQQVGELPANHRAKRYALGARRMAIAEPDELQESVGPGADGCMWQVSELPANHRASQYALRRCLAGFGSLDVTGINKYSEIGNVSAVKMESVIQ